jgi:hypothetical protein
MTAFLGTILAEAWWFWLTIEYSKDIKVPSDDDSEVLSLNKPFPAMIALASAFSTNFLLVGHQHEALGDATEWAIFALHQPDASADLHQNADISFGIPASSGWDAVKTRI